MEHREICTIGDLLIRGANAHPERDVVVFPQARRTYQQLLDGAVSHARALAGLGVGKGDKVGLLAPNSLRYQEVWFGIYLLGAVAVPINNRFRATELRHVIPDADLRVLLVAEDGADVDYFDRVERALGDLPSTAPTGEQPLELGSAPALRHLIDLDDDPRPGYLGEVAYLAAGEMVSEADIAAAAARVALRDIGLIFYTSGTTSLPKGCNLTHEALSRQGLETAERMAFRDGDVMFSPLPMFHSACTQVLYAMLWRYGTYVTMAAFDATTGLRQMASEGATVMYTAFPPITNALVQHPDAGPDTFGRVRSLFTTGTPEELAALEAKLPGTRVVTGFGMTEFAGSIALSDPRDEQAYRLAPGRCMGGAEVEIRDLIGGHPLPPGEEGEIVARGPTGFSSYHNNPQATRAAIDDEGWYHTGDLGLIDDKGLLHFRGRLKDMLKVGGENVAAIEIEAYLGSHPAVQAAAVVGLPDERYGEVPVAFIELADGAVATEGELIDYCRGEIASFKVPHIVRFVEEWPMSATKIRKVDLRDQIRAEVDRT